jgi:hypothetical protein
MAKAPIAAVGTTELRPKAVDVLTGIVDIVLTFRFAERTPTLSDMARIVSTASRLLRFSNLDERIETENQAVLALARKRQLVS